MSDYATTIVRLCQRGLHMTVQQQSILVMCHRQRKKPEERRHSRLATFLKVSKSALTRAASKLRSDGYLLREDVDGDKRMSRLTLTPQGSALVLEIIKGLPS